MTTTINPGDALNLTGGTRVFDMTTLRAAVKDKTKWQPWARGTDADITLTSPWVHGYADTWGSGRVDWTKELLLYWARLEMCLMPNINALNALGSTTFSVNAANNVVSQIRKMTAAEIATTVSSNGNALANAQLLGGALCTQPYGLVPPFYFSATMKIPGFLGAWPAVWMLPTDRSWPPEIDLLEEAHDANAQGSKLTTSIHSNTTGWTGTVKPVPVWVNPDVTTSAYVPLPSGKDPTKTFIEYGCVVYPDALAIFYDRKCVQVSALPSDCNRRWYALIDADCYSGTDPNTAFTALEISDVAWYRMPATYGTGSVTPPPSGDHTISAANYAATKASLDQAAAAILAAKTTLG